MARQARSLDVMVAECNKFAPHRSKVSDGGLGDPRHAASVSDHNPNSNGVWTARDVTNDIVGKRPVGGDDLPGQFLANRLESKFGKHPAMGPGSYIIFNGRIKSFNRRSEGWRRYTGTNAHKSHVHVSVSDAAKGYDSTKPWNLFEEVKVVNAVERMRSELVESKKDLYQAIKSGKDAKGDRETVQKGVKRAQGIVKDVEELLDFLPQK